MVIPVNGSIMATTVIPIAPSGPRYYVRPQHVPVPRFHGPPPTGMPPPGAPPNSVGGTQPPANPVSGVGINSATGQAFDGKHLRKAILRRTIDYNGSVINYIQVHNSDIFLKK